MSPFSNVPVFPFSLTEKKAPLREFCGAAPDTWGLCSYTLLPERIVQGATGVDRGRLAGDRTALQRNRDRRRELEVELDGQLTGAGRDGGGVRLVVGSVHRDGVILVGIEIGEPEAA